MGCLALRREHKAIYKPRVDGASKTRGRGSPQGGGWQDPVTAQEHTVGGTKGISNYPSSQM